VLVIFGISLVVLLLFAGLAIDAGSLYVTYGQLKRAVDAASVAAANDFKRGVAVSGMQAAALEILKLQNVDASTVNLHLYICDADHDGVRDTSLQSTVPEFYARCPDTANGESPRKLIYLSAQQEAPIYFLRLVGFQNIPLSTTAISEAAPIDLVVVFDISESMGKDTALPSPYIVDNYNPNGASGCNPGNTCQPLLQAKNAAKALINTLYPGYDSVSIVTFDDVGVVRQNLTTNMTIANNAVDAIKLHDDPAVNKMWPMWKEYRNPNSMAIQMRFNPVNPEDRDGDGSDVDRADLYGVPACLAANISHWGPQRWDDSVDPYGWGGVPCDDDYKYDASDLDGDGQYTANDDTLARNWLGNHDPTVSGPIGAALSPLSTCTGCGIRTATNVLRAGGRPSAVWVMVFLSDGNVNLSDTAANAGWAAPVAAAYPNGFCPGALNPANDHFWRDRCFDWNPTPRYCIDTAQNTCPPGTTWTGALPNHSYSVLDYAKDMVDTAALTHSTSANEPAGNDIAIYTIGLGDVSAGESLLRYMAAVGDDGDRNTDACFGVPAQRTCGQYYYAPSGNSLLPIFENIASRIYTRISE
jgi:hypothetical protein